MNEPLKGSGSAVKPLIVPNDTNFFYRVGVCNRGTIDPNVPNNAIEWVVKTNGKEIVDFNDPDATIVCTSLMIRVTDNHPAMLPESKWWQWTYYGTEGRNGNQQCNVIYEL